MGRGLAWRTHSRPRRISWHEIAAWAAVSGVNLAAWQIAALSMLDELMVNLIEGIAKGDPVASGKPVTRESVTEFFAAFGAVQKKGPAK